MSPRSSFSSSSLLDSTTGSVLGSSVWNRQKALRPVQGRPLFGIDDDDENGDNNNSCETCTIPPLGTDTVDQDAGSYRSLLNKRLYPSPHHVEGGHNSRRGGPTTLASAPAAATDDEKKSDLEKVVLLDCLTSHFLFAHLPINQLQSLVSSSRDFERCRFRDHEIIVRQHGRSSSRGSMIDGGTCVADQDGGAATADYFYILYSGDLRITKNGKEVSQPHNGSEGEEVDVNGNNNDGSKYTVFGDFAVLTQTPYPVTVQAMSPNCTLFRLGRTAFHRALLPPSTTMVAATAQERLSLLKQDLPKELADHLLAHPAILDKLVSNLSVHSFERGDILVEKSQRLDSLVIIAEGRVVATDISLGGRSDYEDIAIGPGESRTSFGWQSLIGHLPVSTSMAGTDNRGGTAPAPTIALFHGTIVAETCGTALLLSRDAFLDSISVGGGGHGDDGHNIKKMLHQLAAKRLAKIQLQEIPIFKNSALDDTQLDGLLDLMHRCEYEASNEGIGGDQGRADMTIFKVGDKVEAGMYFVRQGGVTLWMDKGQTQQVIEAGGYFGEKNLLLDQHKDVTKHCVSRSTMSAVAHSPITVLDVLYLEECRTVVDTRLLGLGKGSSVSAIDTSIQWSDLERHALLGTGTFGQVWLASASPSPAPQDALLSTAESDDNAEATPSTSRNEDRRRRVVALKVQAKHQLIQSGNASRMVAERNILASLNSPFIVRLFNAFQDHSRLYMVTTLLQGGELESIMSSDGLSESAARFYAAGVLEGLTYLHRRHILHRDVKASNVMIKSNGYPALIDLGFAKYVPDKTYTFCGSPMYIAPEIIRYKGHDKGCDHWSWAVLLYKMVTGRFPFYEQGADELALYKRICKGTFELDGSMSLDFRSLMVQILYPDPTQRLGCRANGGWRDIYVSPWFAARDGSFDLRLLRRQELPAPWVPVLNHPLDSSKFRADPSDAEDFMTATFPPLSNEQQLIFASFGPRVDDPK